MHSACRLGGSSLHCRPRPHASSKSCGSSSSSSSSSSRSTLSSSRPSSSSISRNPAWRSQAYKLTPQGGAALTVEQARFVIGSDGSADLRLQQPGVAGEHAELQQKGKQVFLKALQGEFVFDRTFTFIDDQEARPNVSYVLASGSRLAFGEQQQSCYVVEFDEPSGANPLVEVLMQGMAAGANPDVKKALND